jgi:hypothetical protein
LLHITLPFLRQLEWYRVEVKLIKLSLCFARYHAMKTYALLN